MSERFPDALLLRLRSAYQAAYDSSIQSTGNDWGTADRAGMAAMRAVLEGHRASVWIVTEFDSRRIRGVFISQSDAEAGIAQISAEHPDLARADFVIEVQRVRVPGAASDGSQK